jgi:NhaA family Na+:H+ antiporter
MNMPTKGDQEIHQPGIGFTMSLFIGALAFEDASLMDSAKIGTLAGSILSGVFGFATLRLMPPVPAMPQAREEAEEWFGEDYGEDPVIEHYGSTE